ncbi:futalosine nucleosidase [Geobacter metallireducens RCH3]|uniref:Futalosine hydrolase n=1 Tax=Geobacter metallireducens (strain ATCC 53774 / DSM 7210 / GS-15) TaxID=269799 RepID=Q39Q81_GEOMG|nr:futalosine hydrolase [Geobacter metallireducens]ABB33593.1 futalosine hydrolase, putative [Geobacter metallireducens GS-15]EHP87703.1 futalosine nucleosidase [Geobacter metallireducens RCH3]
MDSIIIAAATSLELSLLVRSIGAREVRRKKGFSDTYRGKVGGTTVLLAVTGIGKANTASALTALLERYTPRLLIDTGCAGAYGGGGLAVGDLAVASTEVYGDEGILTPSGWESLEIIGIPQLERGGRRFFNEFPLALLPAERAVQLGAALGVPVRRGRFVTVSTCSGTTARGNALARRFNAICENMEGAVAAHLALRYGIDCLELRGISNMVEDRDLSGWNIPLAVERAQRFILKFLETCNDD